MRHKELESVFTYFFDQLVHLSKKHPNDVKQARNKLKTEMEVDFYENWKTNVENGGRLTTYSVYEFVRKIDDILLGAHERRASESGPHRPKVVNAPHKPKENPNPDLAAATKAGVKGTASAATKMFSRLSGSDKPGWSSEKRKMFDDAHDHIQKRQEMLADELIVLRNAELERWKKALQDGNETVSYICPFNRNHSWAPEHSTPCHTTPLFAEWLFLLTLTEAWAKVAGFASGVTDINFNRLQLRTPSPVRSTLQAPPPASLPHRPAYLPQFVAP